MKSGQSEKSEGDRKPCILIVDDNYTERYIYKTVLKKFDVDIKEAENGNEAMEILESAPIPKLLIVDLNMPEMDGLGLVKEMKRLPETCRIPIIISTGTDDLDLREKALSMGVTGFLNKPLMVKDFLPIVESALNQ